MTMNPELTPPHLVTRIMHLPMTSDAAAFCMSARVTERIVVELPEPAPEHCGGLASFVISAVESALAARGAAPPGWQVADCLESKLDDQLYRARWLGAGGLALRFGGLRGIADADGQLGAEDSAVLRRLLSIAERENLQLFLPDSVAALRILDAPRQLSDWLPSASRDGRIAVIEYEANVAEGVAGAALPDSDAALVAPPIEAFAAERPAEPSGSPPTQAEPAGEAVRDAELPPADETARSDGASLAETPTAPSIAEERPEHDLPVTEATSPEAADNEAPPHPERVQRCAAWAAQLRSMNGPKVYASVERAFLTAYLPLSREVAAGRAPEDARAALETWAEGFAQSYATAFKSLASRTKRPRMVRDVIELSIAWLNQLRARQCQLLMVDGMRFDLGERLNECLERQLNGRATCAEHAMLWAALPSNAESQQLGVSRSVRRGVTTPERKRDGAAAEASRIETLRAGTRELFRLDHLSADLARPGEAEADRLGRLAESLAATIVPWLMAQPPDTLVVIFGDHGFHWQASPRGTSGATRGGALPEQVLTPASGWLLGHAARAPRTAAGLH